MDDDQGGGKLSRRRKSMLRGQVRDAAQSNCRQKQKRKPCASADESGDVSKKQPGHTGDGEDDERRNSPTTISPARTPGARQDGKRRNDRDKKKNVIQVQHPEVRCLKFEVKNVTLPSCASLSPIISTSFPHGVFGRSRPGRN